MNDAECRTQDYQQMYRLNQYIKKCAQEKTLRRLFPSREFCVNKCSRGHVSIAEQLSVYHLLWFEFR
jgi:hypothetical protein